MANTEIILPPITLLSTAPNSPTMLRGVCISRTVYSILVLAKSNFTNGDTEPRLLHIHDFNFRGLAVLSRNLRNINASKITRYTVNHGACVCIHSLLLTLPSGIMWLRVWDSTLRRPGGWSPRQGSTTSTLDYAGDDIGTPTCKVCGDLARRSYLVEGVCHLVFC